MANGEVTRFCLFICFSYFICLFSILRAQHAHACLFMRYDAMNIHTHARNIVCHQTRSTQYFSSECRIPFIILFTQQNNNRIVISGWHISVGMAMKFIYEHLLFHGNTAAHGECFAVYTTTTTCLCQTLLDTLSTLVKCYTFTSIVDRAIFFLSLQSIAAATVAAAVVCECANIQRRP